MELIDWAKAACFITFVLSMMLIYGDVVGPGVLFLIIFIALCAVLLSGVLDKKKGAAAA